MQAKGLNFSRGGEQGDTGWDGDSVGRNVRLTVRGGKNPGLPLFTEDVVIVRVRKKDNRTGV